MKSTEYRSIIEGASGIRPTLWRGLFRLVSIPYALGVRGGDLLWRLRWKRARRLDRPTISVGNLTLGGTGKTPFVAFLTGFLLDAGFAPALLSRGYQAARPPRSNGADVPFRAQNDEALELAELFPEVPHYLSPDRFTAGKALLQDRPERNVILLDDGFQHRRLARDLDILLLDATEPFGFDRLFPSGTLREPLSALRRADIILLSRADLVTPDRRAEIRLRAERFNQNAFWGEIAHRPIGLIQFENGRFVHQPLEKRSKTEKFAAFCGIGNPDGFFKSLERENFSLVGTKIYPDHYAFTESDAEHLSCFALSTQTDALLCSRKDLVKIRRSEIGGIPLFALDIGVEFLAGREPILETIRQTAGRLSR